MIPDIGMFVNDKKSKEVNKTRLLLSIFVVVVHAPLKIHKKILLHQVKKKKDRKIVSQINFAFYKIKNKSVVKLETE